MINYTVYSEKVRITFGADDIKELIHDKYGIPTHLINAFGADCIIDLNETFSSEVKTLVGRKINKGDKRNG